ncbi:cytochrome P450 [Streptomyces nanshensis]|uniref:cytochrome P450 n=1 Tax=Streptomyces nanshensis TaxID=518642 RepID=UPI000A9E7EB5|nr:cytochrome P450 [Streptomyces nanshensis]
MLFTHPGTSRNVLEHWHLNQEGHDLSGFPQAAIFHSPSMGFRDGEDHQRMREPVQRALSPSRIKALRPRIESITAALLDDLERRAAQGGSVDLKRYFALPLPMEVICDLLGVDDVQTRARLRDLSARVVDNSIPAPDEDAPDPADFPREVARFVASKRQGRRSRWSWPLRGWSRFVARKRERPDDLTRVLIDECDRGSMTEEELVANLVLIVLGGHETTVNLLTTAIQALLDNRDQLQALREGRIAWKWVVEEALRWNSPLAYDMFRVATEDLEIDGHTIKAGDAVAFPLAALGRCPVTHPSKDRDRFDITREHRRHLGFGHGPHLCVGAPLARAEAEIGLEALFERFPDMELDSETEQQRLPSLTSNGVTSLRVRLTRP